MPASLLSAVSTSLAPIAVLIGLGYLWRLTSPGGVDALHARRAITALVIYIFYPALTYDIIRRARFGPDMLWLPLFTIVGVLLGAALAALLFTPWLRAGKLSRPQFGALVIACAFGNVLAMGMAVLQPLFGAHAARYALYADILGISVLFWTLGLGVAFRFGSTGTGNALPTLQFVKSLARMPPIWAFIVGALVNLFALPSPEWVNRTAALAGQAAVPAILLTVGMALSPATLRRAPVPILLACLLKLLIVPALIAGLCIPLLGLQETSQAIVLLAAMPTMMAALVLAEWYGLDVELLSAVLVASTLGFFGILPLWLALLH